MSDRFRYDLFPATRAIPEDQQVGRTDFIDQVQASVLNGANVLLLEDRRTGKSSVARAVIERLRLAEQSAPIGLMVDLSDGTRNSAEFAEQIRKQSREQEGLKRLVAQKLAAKDTAGKISSAMRGKGKAIGNLVGGALDDEQLGQAIPGLLPQTEGRPLHDVLEALDREARLADIRVVIFIDEVQRLASWDDAADTKAALHAVSTRTGTHLNFIFAGSERSAIETMFGEDDPMDFFGDRLHLPDIPYKAWKDALGQRFERAGLQVEDGRITQILKETDGHPGRTIAICRNILGVVHSTVTQAAVAQAIEMHRRDPAWKKLHRD